jgi:hypothetical protein
MKTIILAVLFAVLAGCAHTMTPQEQADWDALTPAQRQEAREREADRANARRLQASHNMSHAFDGMKNQSQSVNCTSSTYGSSTYTNCNN